MIHFDSTEYIPVMEHFYSIQGEGYYAGQAAYFIRLAGCDVGCHWCDVKDSWSVNKQQFMLIKDLVKYIQQTNCKLIIITGGEPLMYSLITLTDILKKFDYQINIETSGTYSLSGFLDWVCVSPKKFKSILPEVLVNANELKIIVYNQSDFKFAEENLQLYKNLNPTKYNSLSCYLQAEWSVRDKIYPLLVNYIKQNPKWQLSIQQHKYLNIP